MNRDQIAHVLRTRTPYQISTRPGGAVVAMLTPWHGAIVRPGKRPTVIGTIPDPACLAIFVLGTFLTLGILGLVWLNAIPKSEDVVKEIRWIFRKELGIETT